MAAEISTHRTPADYNLVGPNAARAVERGLADAKWYASPIPKEQMRELLERRNGPAVRDTIIWFALLFGLGLAGLALWGTWWAIIPFALYGVVYASSSDSRWHESSHGTAFKSDWLNNALYEIASFMVMRESVVWRWSHARHHSDTIIVGRDAEIAFPRPVARWDVIGKFFAIPGIFRYFRTVWKHVFGQMTPAERTFIPEAEFGKVYWRARVYLLIYLAVLAFALATRSILPLMFIGLPALYGTWLMVVYGGTQHAGLAENVLDHRLNTRTVYMNRINRYLYWNMGYHIEHHMFPMVPYHNLPKLHELMKHDVPPPYHGLLAAWREIIPTLRRQAKDPDYFIRRPVPVPAAQAEAARTAQVITSAAPPDAAGWVAVCDLNALLPGDVLRFEHADRSYAIYRTQIGQLFATDGFCTHGRAHLADGFLQGTCIECTKHNGRFEIRDGSVRRPPPRHPLRTYPARERDGKVMVNVAAAGASAAAAG
jgi:MocE subfamily Rieske [2Fe-2S] domain protein